MRWWCPAKKLSHIERIVFWMNSMIELLLLTLVGDWNKHEKYAKVKLGICFFNPPQSKATENGQSSKMLGILGIWEKFSYFSSGGRWWSQGLWEAFSHHEFHFLVWCLEKIDHIPQMVVSWWFTMIESKKNHLIQTQVFRSWNQSLSVSSFLSRKKYILWDEQKNPESARLSVRFLVLTYLWKIK